ncbi:lysophospholipase-like protein 1 isoform X2 [Centrocercus urophasianus]|uniref:lysophospholipase-like protein 1 isoform X2 n=1 Tax=Centrocercus urophasianus TaxID=9002 RepID=UPI001C647113|nr:lysophospholipase-like protein 1 isoform X2 [Centrocercus urophasianus]
MSFPNFPFVWVTCGVWFCPIPARLTLPRIKIFHPCAEVLAGCIAFGPGELLVYSDTGQGVRTWIKQILNQDMVFQHIKVIYPTAPARPYTPMKGATSTVWFDRYKISNDCPEHIESIDAMCQELTDLINDEMKNGITKGRILIGGFSMGGGMAMHLAYRFHQDLAGVFALSSFLNKDSAVYEALKRNESVLPELFQCHGTADDLVLYSWGEETNKMLKSLGVSTSLHTFPNLNHELNRNEIEELKTWILKKLPIEAEKSNE